MVKIRCPSWTEVVNPGKYYSCKGFYALNVQAIVDKKKRNFWRTIGKKGSAHDCSFGEIDRRWGIFWKPLQGQLRNHKYIIDSALRLHNFIVDYREEIGGTSTTMEKRFEREELNVASDDFLMENPYDMIGPLSELDEMRKTGPPTTAEARDRVRG